MGDLGRAMAFVVLAQAGLLAGLLGAAAGVSAQPAWKPEKPVELVVTCQPGCGPDIAARLI